MLDGCLRAGQECEDHCSNVLMNMGIERAASSPVALHHPSRVPWALVHGDDFMFTWTDVDLNFILIELSLHYEIKNRGRLRTCSADVQDIDAPGRMGATTLLGNLLESRSETPEHDHGTLRLG